MAKSDAPGIKKEKHGNITRLSIKPFLDAKLAELEITTDIAALQAGRTPQSKTWFSGVSMSTPLRAGDVVVWMAAMRAMQEETQKLIEKMRA